VTAGQVEAVAAAGRKLRDVRRKLREDHPRSLRDLYRTLDKPGKNVLRDAQDLLDIAVCAAYGVQQSADPLEHLLSLNLALAAKEASGKKIVGPGVPASYGPSDELISSDCIGN
jgi:hypothetical protein